MRTRGSRLSYGTKSAPAGAPLAAPAAAPSYAPVFESVQPVSPRQPIGRAERWSAGGGDVTPGAGARSPPASPRGPAYTMRAR